MREMKDSGIEWIGEIPKDWEKIKLKDYYNFEKGKKSSKYTKEYMGLNKGIFPVYSGQTENNGIMGNINTYGYDIKECLFTTTVGAKAMTPKVLSGKFSLSQNCLVMNKIKKCNNIFFYFAICSLFNYEKSLIPFYMQPSLRIEDLKKYILFIPNIIEQKYIADYLDDKCSKIDTIIEKQQIIIKKLKEYKISLITEAVTNVKGISYRVKYVSTMKNGLNFKSFLDGNKIKFLDVGDFKEYFILDDKEMFSDIIINEKIDDDYMLNSGDIVFVRSNGSKDLVGRSVMVKNIDFPLVYSGFCIRLRNIRKDILNNTYLLYYFRSFYFRTQLKKYSQGSNINNINQDLLSNISLTIPTLETQTKIVKFLDKKCNAIDSSIQKKQAIIDKLTEYKKSLIYEVVTGKKEI